MRGSIRHRGDERGGSWEYIVDMGMATAQRCQSCGRRFWVERKPKRVCPKCGGELIETEERRRAIKGGHSTRKECLAAMNKLWSQSRNRPSSPRPSHREGVPQKRVAAGRQVDDPRLDLQLLRPARRLPRRALHRHGEVAEGHRRHPERVVCEAGRVGAQERQARPLLRHRPPRARMPASRLPRRREVGAAGAQPRRRSRPAQPGGTERREMRTWTAEQLRAFLAFTKDDELYSLWHTLAMTGMRRGEGLGLRWEDVDFETARLAVRRALIPSGRDVVVSEPKTARGRRSIALDPETVAVLKAQAARQLEHQADWQEGWCDSGYVFTAEDGQSLNPEAVTRWFRQAVRKSMLPKIRLHDLRHTHATLALQAGIHPKVVSERLGHATVAITLDTYSHAIPAMQEEAAVLIAELVFAAK